MTVKERLISFLKYKNISQSDFGKSIGASAAYVTSMRKSIGTDYLDKISGVYPELNTEWLLTGRGEMIKLSPEKEKSNALNVLIDRDVLKTLMSQQETIASQQQTIQQMLDIIAKKDERLEHC